jgi:hypothetical protein
MAIESGKLLHDTYKHLTTLSTGCIVLLSTFLEKLFQKPDWRFLVVVAFTSFVVSVVASVVAMFGNSSLMHAQEFSTSLKVDEQRVFLDVEITRLRKLALIVVPLSCGGFLIGVVALALFGVKNFANG